MREEAGAQTVISLLQRSQPTRTFVDRPVPDIDLDQIISAIRWTPSAANLQPWEVLAIGSPEGKARVVSATLDPMMRHDEHDRQAWIVDAPLVLVLFADVRRVRARFGEAAERIAQQDVAAASLSALVTARCLGIAGCRVYEFDPELLREQLGVPRFFFPVAILALGYSETEPALPPTLEPSAFTHREKW